MVFNTQSESTMSISRIHGNDQNPGVSMIYAYTMRLSMCVNKASDTIRLQNIQKTIYTHRPTLTYSRVGLLLHQTAVGTILSEKLQH